MPTLEPPTPEPPTPEPPTIAPPTATFTEFPSLTATFTETPSPTLTLTETETPTVTLTPSATMSETSTPTFVLSPTVTPNSDLLDPDLLTPPPLVQIMPLSGPTFALVNGSDETALYAAVAAVNAGTVDTIYLNADGTLTSPVADRTYELTDRLSFQRSVIIHGNGAILQQRASTAGNFVNRVLFVPSGVSVTVYHTTFTGADLRGYSQSAGGYGGAIRIQGGSLTLVDSVVQGNAAINGGGGIYNAQSGVLTLTRVRVSGNTAGGGAGIQNDQGGIVGGECVQIESNTANYGSGVLHGNFNNSAGQMTLRWSRFDQNAFLAGASNPRGLDVFNLTPATQLDTGDSYWGADGVPEVGDDIDNTSVLVNPIRTTDPTIPNSTTGQYEIAACAPQAPATIPVIPTPTPTATPPLCSGRSGFDELRAFSADEEVCVPDIECSDGTISLVPQIQIEGYRQINASTLQELEDMRVMIPGTGVFPLRGPTLNAARYGTAFEYFTWSDRLRVFARVQFPQTVNGQPDRQIWYQVGFLMDTEAKGWVPARYDGNNYTEGTYTSSSDPCGSIPAPATLTFEYNRAAAADYAIEHSYDTAVLQGGVYNHSVLQSQGLVTQRLTAIPPFASLPLRYAYFRYSGIGQAQFVTGSAVFVSESLWMGGMPMTVGNPDCAIAGTTDAGWRYCFSNPGAVPPVGDASNPFDTHNDLFAYWTSNPFNSVLRSNPNNVPGRLVATIIGQSTSLSELSIFYPDAPGAIGRGVLENPSGLSQYIAQRVGQDIQQGDYLFIDSAPNHGLVIIGWGSAENCPAAIFANGIAPNITPYAPPTTANPRGVYRDWSVGQFGESYQLALNSGIANPVPWVVDFTSPPNLLNDGQNVTQETQSPVPRPFYCTLYRETTGLDFFSAHDWQFFAIPNQVQVSTITSVPHQLYVDVQWQWEQ